MKPPFVGPSYDIKVRKADVQRSVNLMPTPVEAGNGKAGVFLKPVPGLVSFSEPAEVSACAPFLLDTFTDPDNTNVLDHVPDIYPSGLGEYRTFSTSTGAKILGNEAVYDGGSLTDGGAQQLYRLDEGPIGLTFPYYVWMTGEITSGGEVFLKMDGPEVMTAVQSRIYLSLYEDGNVYATLWVYDEEGNEVFTWEPTAAISLSEQHTVGFFIEETGATFVVDGEAVDTYTAAMPSDGVYVMPRLFPLGLDPVVGSMTAYGICVGGTLADALALDGTAL